MLVIVDNLEGKFYKVTVPLSVKKSCEKTQMADKQVLRGQFKQKTNTICNKVIYTTGKNRLGKDKFWQGKI